MTHLFGKPTFKERVTGWRWRLAGWLSYLACRLRGQKWYVGDTWHGVQGNRAAELKQKIWLDAVSQICRFREEQEYQEFIDDLEPRLDELAQLAGENFGEPKACPLLGKPVER